MGLGAYGGGFLYDYLGTYWTLHLVSTFVGAAAVAMALTLRAPGRAPALAPGHLTDS
jgi:predicted MFS family arabinose efflux permease